MKLHHQKHHQTYVNNLNAAEEKLTKALAEGILFTDCALVDLVLVWMHTYTL